MNLPDNIDYTLYHSNSGMATSFFGPNAWNFLFISILGHYPIKIDNTNPEHIEIVKNYYNILTSLSVIMPCVFCRDSFKIFIKELPIEPYLIGRIELMYWLYLMKDKVNNKLIQQEENCYNDEKKILKALYYNQHINTSDYYIKIAEFKKKIFKTIPTPPFEDILKHYEQYRAVCSPKNLTCVLPSKEIENSSNINVDITTNPNTVDPLILIVLTSIFFVIF